MEYGKELSHSFRFRAVMGQKDEIQRDWPGQGWEHPETWLDEQFRTGEL